jgi:L-arabinose isomerase
MLELEDKEFDTHEYVRSVRQMKNEQYMACFDEYARKYAIAPTKKEISKKEAAKKEVAKKEMKKEAAASEKKTGKKKK